VLESSWRSDVRALAADGLARAGVTCPLEIWCDVSPELAWSRYIARFPTRHPIHGALMRRDDEGARMVAHAEPLGLGPVYRVDTSGPVDIDALVAWCHANAAASVT
jgi:glucokinase